MNFDEHDGLQTREQMLAGLTVPTVAAQQFGLDEKALEAAREQPGTNHDGIIRAYLSALPSSPVSELVDLRECLDRFVEAFPAAAGYPLIKRGYASLTTLSTRNAELEREVKRLREALADVENHLDGEPEYHSQGMGCGLEDRCITDRYEAMEHGWEQAIERVYAEHINHARAVLAALSTAPQGGEHE